MTSGWLWLLLTLLLLWLIWSIIRQRDIALAFVRGWCARQQLQLLDDSVAYYGLRRLPKQQTRGARNMIWRPVQAFRFEVSSDGRERRAGLLLMQGLRIILLEIQELDGSHLIDTLHADSTHT